MARATEAAIADLASQDGRRTWSRRRWRPRSTTRRSTSAGSRLTSCEKPETIWKTNFIETFFNKLHFLMTRTKITIFATREENYVKGWSNAPIRHQVPHVSSFVQLTGPNFEFFMLFQTVLMKFNLNTVGTR